MLMMYLINKENFKKEYPMIVRKYFRDGDYGKGCRKHHFMWMNLKNQL